MTFQQLLERTQNRTSARSFTGRTLSTWNPWNSWCRWSHTVRITAILAEGTISTENIYGRPPQPAHTNRSAPALMEEDWSEALEPPLRVTSSSLLSSFTLKPCRNMFSLPEKPSNKSLTSDMLLRSLWNRADCLYYCPLFQLWLSTESLFSSGSGWVSHPNLKWRQEDTWY